MQYDLILASDCLYFSNQEAPLAAVLRRRLRVDGKALLVVQCRCGQGFLLARFFEQLRLRGMTATANEGPWQWDALLAAHVRGTPGQEMLTMCHTINENGEPVFLTVSKE